MAVSKNRKGRSAEMPDAAAFVRVLDEGLADPPVVNAAYEQALADYTAGKTYTERLQDAFQSGGIVAERPVIDPDEQKTPEARMLELTRVLTFKDGGR